MYFTLGPNRTSDCTTLNITADLIKEVNETASLMLSAMGEPTLVVSEEPLNITIVSNDGEQRKCHNIFPEFFLSSV